MPGLLLCVKILGIIEHCIELYSRRQISVIICAAVNLLAWSPDGRMYVMVIGDHIDVCAFEVGNVMLDLLLTYFIFVANEIVFLPWFVFCWC